MSSTYLDLVKHRKLVADAIERLGQQGVGMEVFGARPAEPLDACFKEIEACDLVVGVYAYRYGFVPDGSDVSIAELEYRHAKTLGRPLFCFVVDDEHPWPPKLIDSAASKQKLATFKNVIGTTNVQESFTTPEDLALKVATSLGRYLSQDRSEESGRDIDQVAAVCYRRMGEAVEFLLVRTSGRRWVFPKGGIDGEEEEWEAAAREAHEESGAMGSVEHKRLTVFLHLKQELQRQGVELKVAAYLLEVDTLVTPEEEHRSPIWFPPQQAIRALAEGREFVYAKELTRVVKEACAAIG